MGKDYYKILGVAKNADDEALRKAYRASPARRLPAGARCCSRRRRRAAAAASRS